MRKLKIIEHISLDGVIQHSDGITSDIGAVRAALEYEWSNGQVEGQVHRLKLVKRQM